MKTPYNSFEHAVFQAAAFAKGAYAYAMGCATTRWELRMELNKGT